MKSQCIAMWSGPRNISTAMMRAWENRSDTTVVDEPFYAHFLEHTGLDHPMRAAVIAAGKTDWRDVVSSLVNKPSTGLFYQKHITTHWLQHFTVDWLTGLEHVFLIREPEPVVASYAIKRMGMTATDLGYVQQAALFDQVTSIRGSRPLVIDSQRFLKDPKAQLQTVCTSLAIEFDTAMLSWPSGVRDSDGVWGEHWYDAVRQSTGFAPYRYKPVQLDARQQRIADSCRPYYDSLASFAI